MRRENSDGRAVVRADKHGVNQQHNVGASKANEMGSALRMRKLMALPRLMILYLEYFI